jgi:hypothetical protein
MSRSTKIILAVFTSVVVLILLCAGTFVISLGGLAWNGMARAMEYDAADVSREAETIADFELPDGYAPNYALTGAGFRMVDYDLGDGHSHLMLVQAPEWAGLNQAKFEQQVRRNLGDKLKWGEDTKSKIVDRRSLRVAGEPVEFAIREGVNSTGGDYRAMTGVWDSPKGQVLIYVEEPLAHWNQAEIDAFIASIR